MRIEELSARTSKDDGTYSGIEETLLYRGGFLRGSSSGCIYTTTGTMLIENIREVMSVALEANGAKRISVPGCFGIKGMRESMTEYLNSDVRSYRDLPSGIFSFSDVLFGHRATDSLWSSPSYPVMSFAFAGASKGAVESAIDEFLKSLGLKGMSHEGVIVHESESAAAELVCIKGPEPAKPYAGRSDKAELVETSDVRTIAALTEFFSCSGRDILKTVLLTNGDCHAAVVIPGDNEVDIEKVSSYLDITDSSLKQMSEADIRRLTLADVGFSGPVGLKDIKVLVHHGVVSGKGYIAGANRTGYHLSNVVPGRDFTGEQGDFARSGIYVKGHVIGRMRMLRESMRTPGEDGRPHYSPVQFGYLNLHRLLLTIASKFSDEKGVNLPDSLAPFEAAVIPSDARNEELVKKAIDLHDKLLGKGARVLLDLRNQRMGSKLFDCELMSIRHRVIAGDRLEAGFFEYKARSGEITPVNFDELVEILSV
jgi:prolyl-tRNA synthetase